jgi:tetratricopeptide (TPR) repeat protein
VRVFGLAIVAAACLATSFAAAKDSGPEETAQDEFDRASELLAEEDHSGAATAFAYVASRFPDASGAADALFLAGKLHEERLGNPNKAAELYAKLVSDYPNSRVTRAAEHRLQRLRQEISGKPSHAEASAAFTSLLTGAAEASDRDLIGRAEDILRRHPDWPGRGRVHLWIGSAHLRQGDLDHAIAAFAQAIETGDDDIRFEATRRAMEVALIRDDFAHAEELIGNLSTDDPARAETVAEARAKLASARFRKKLYLGALALLLFAVVVLLVLVRRGANTARDAVADVLEAPTEALFLLAVIAVLFLMSLTGHTEIAPAVATVGIGAVLLTWLTGVAVRQLPTVTRGLVCTSLAVAGVVAFAYIALLRTNLLDLMLATLRFGPDH